MSGNNLDWGDLQQEAERLGERGDKEEAPRQGRRDRRGVSEEKTSEKSPSSPEESGKSPPVRKSAGWGAEESKSSSEGKESKEEVGGKFNKKTKRSSTARALLEGDVDGSETTTSTQKQSKHFQDDDGDIMIIPDLDEDREEDLQLKVAEAPQNFRTVQSLHELDKQISGLQLPDMRQPNDGKLNLSVLTCVLVPRDKLTEPDEPWEFEQLLEQVSQEMTRQKESNEEFERSQAVGASSQVTVNS